MLLVFAGNSPDAHAAGNDATARTLLNKLETATGAAERLAAAKELAELKPAPVKVLREFLARKHKSNDAERRKVLRAIRAAVPNRKGRFYQPRRMTKKKMKRRDNLDWLAKLVTLKDRPALGEVIADVATIRALAASKHWTGADAVFDLSFTKRGLIYRDECGRYLRKMAPYSLPTLIRNSGIRKRRSRNRSRIRYATYQLERLDRQLAVKAINATGADERLRAELFHAFRDVFYRDAARPILEWVNDTSPVVRKAARGAWMAYVTGPKPKKPPERKLKLPGGKETKKKKKLWLHYRDLAKNALYERAEQLFGEKPSGEELGPLSKKVFAHYDGKRAERNDKEVNDAVSAAKQNRWDSAIPALNRILARSPKHEKRHAFANAFYEFAMYLEDKKKWREASAAYGKANAIAPNAENAVGALANRHYMIGRALVTEGKDGTGEYRKALSINPNHRRAKAALQGKNPDKVARTAGASGGTKGDQKWMLYLGLGGGAAALLLLGVALITRRRNEG